MKTTIASIVLLSALTAFANDADDAQEAQVRVDKGELICRVEWHGIVLRSAKAI